MGYTTYNIFLYLLPLHWFIHTSIDIYYYYSILFNQFILIITKNNTIHYWIFLRYPCCLFLQCYHISIYQYSTNNTNITMDDCDVDGKNFVYRKVTIKRSRV